MTNNVISYLKGIDFFSCLDETVLINLASHARIYKKNAGDVLFYEKEDKEEVYYVVKGSLKFYKVDRFDNEIFLYKQESNSLIYNVSKLCSEYIISCYSNAEFLEDSEILIFDSGKFQEAIQTNQSFMKAILKESFQMIQKLQCIISRDIVYDGTAKVAHMLVHDLENFNKLKKHEIAYMLHIQPETLSRILKKLIRNEVIEVEKNCVVILDVLALKSIYE
jgi:CRP/FNR family transcriptional regulator, cyclic AMP receptor protein